ncbi:MAG: YihY/virulence factor BrkB family protein [Candidatus Glassbacteria bacterium]|nr:YihY/virulence factor BrkB family protein [Candidatus Glassbacteria bacterium]
MLTVWYYIKNLYLKFIKDDVLFLASGIAFSLLICLIPLMLIVFSIVGFSISSSSELWDRLVPYLESIIPISSESIINNTYPVIRDHKLIGAIGLIGVAFTATRLFATVRVVLDCVFEVRHTRGIIHGKLFDFSILLILGMLMVLANLGITFMPDLSAFDIDLSGNTYSIYPLIESRIFALVVPFVLTVALILFSYKFFPSKRTRTDTCLIATAIAGMFWEITKYLYKYYLSLYPTFNRIYGTLAALVAILIWFYLASIVYVMAAEIAFIHEKRTARSH